MKQLQQNLRTGKLSLVEIPKPSLSPTEVLIKTEASLISPGTEKMLMEFGNSNLLGKAISQPDRLKEALDKARVDGVFPTLQSALNKLDTPIPLGYCNAGTVIEVGENITDLNVGDRIASNGPHAEIVAVPRNLCAKIPQTVTSEEAAFTPLASIALQGIRLLNPTFGEIFTVYGLGLVGLLTVQLLQKNGCKVIAIDPNKERLQLAKQLGAVVIESTDPKEQENKIYTETNGYGADGSVITAASKSNSIISNAAQTCRKKGRIILIGVVGLDLKRSDFYEKELTFQVSCSYGPGRYDTNYEYGQDYPLGFVRWTEERNFLAILESLRNNNIDVSHFITNRIAFSDVEHKYKSILEDPTSLGVIIQYETNTVSSRKIPNQNTNRHNLENPKRPTIGIIGAGNFSSTVLLPILSKMDCNLKYISAKTNGLTAKHSADKFNIDYSVTDSSIIIDDPSVEIVFIATRHDSHAKLVCESLLKNKNIYVEKPLCLNVPELDEVQNHYLRVSSKDRGELMIGYNRRFSSHTLRIKELLRSRASPLTMSMTINSGNIPKDHWTQDKKIGGGRIIGEACHFMDLMVYITGANIEKLYSLKTKHIDDSEDEMTIVMGFSDGSTGTINYFSNGSKKYPKETLEIFSDQRVIRMENFQRTKSYGFNIKKNYKTFRQDKGHKNAIHKFINNITTTNSPLINFRDIYNVSKASILAIDSANTGVQKSV